MLSLLKPLLASLGACDAATPSKLQRQLMKHSERMRSAAKGVQLLLIANPTSAVLEVVTAESALPACLQLLDRVLTSNHLGGSPRPLGKTEAAIANMLLSLSVACFDLITQVPHSPSFESALHAMLAVQPGRILSAAMRLGSTGQPQSAAQQALSQQSCYFAAQCVTLLLSNILYQPLSVVAIAPQLIGPDLWALTCRAICGQPTSLRCADSAACILVLLHTVLSAPTAAEGHDARHAAGLVYDAMTAEVTFGSMLLSAAAAPGQPALTNAMRALDVWLQLSPVSLALPVGERNVIDLANVTSAIAGGPYHVQNSTLIALFQRLTQRQQQRAFPAFAAHAARALGRTAAPALAAAAYINEDADGYTIQTLLQSTVCLPSVLVFAASGFQDTQPHASKRWQDLAVRARWLAEQGVVAKCEALLRAEWRHGSVWSTTPACHELRCAVNVAALLMDDGMHDVPTLVAALSTMATARKALTRWVAVANTDIPAEGAAGSRAAVSRASMASATAIVSTATAATAGDTAATAASAAAAPATSTTVPAAAAPATAAAGIPVAAGNAHCAADKHGASGPADGPVSSTPAMRPPCEATNNMPARPATNDSDSTVLAALLEALCITHGHPPLRKALFAGRRAGRILITCGAVQLLPVLLGVARRLLRAGPVCDADAEVWKKLLAVLVEMNLWNLGDLTAALGVPALLLHLVRTLPKDLPDAVFLVESALNAVQHGQLYSAWLRDVARLSLLEECTARLAELPAELMLAAASRPECSEMLARAVPSAGSPGHQQDVPPAVQVHRYLTKHFGNLASALRQDIDGYLAETEGQVVRAAPTWDSYLLSTLSELLEELSGGGWLTPWVGCCYHRCQNFSGDSERALKLHRCGGCLLTRYCSAECQRKAWRSGHRAACLGWQLQHF